MYINKIQVEEGFLDGLEIDFQLGLNVLIGARGTGKTSLIELIRFCLGVPGYTAESHTRSLEHALAILGPGRVTLTLVESDHHITASRSADEDEPRISSGVSMPVMFSQSEIEAVGLQAKGRLLIIDGFRDTKRLDPAIENKLAGQVESFTAEADALRREIQQIDDQLVELAAIDEQLKALKPEEEKLAKISSDAAKQKERLDATTKEGAELAVTADFVERFRRLVSNWSEDVQTSIQSAPELEHWPRTDPPDPIAKLRGRVSAAIAQLEQVSTELQRITQDAQKIAKKTSDKHLENEEKAREIRKRVEELQEGAGIIARRGQVLRQTKAQLESLKPLRRQRYESLRETIRRRSDALDQLDNLRSGSFKARQEIARTLSQRLGPSIRITVEQSSQFDAYESTISEALRGSGLKYHDLATLIARRISPRELLEIIDTDNFEQLSDVIRIGKDRAARVISHLSDSNMGAISTVLIDDGVQFQLLDGHDYKDILEVSTGQRCTVLLPIILEHRDQILIIDQPEDHIDNAFIVDTLIRSLLNRSSVDQIILSSHNANIPVLGNADRVIELGSDGRTGFMLKSSHLDDPSIVDAISSIMEGGKEAFKRRAEFYSQASK